MDRRKGEVNDYFKWLVYNMREYALGSVYGYSRAKEKSWLYRQSSKA